MWGACRRSRHVGVDRALQSGAAPATARVSLDKGRAPRARRRAEHAAAARARRRALRRACPPASRPACLLR